MWAAFIVIKKTIQSKQSSIGRKFAQSGHPGQGSRQGALNGHAN
jgi:hypothetical protein